METTQRFRPDQRIRKQAAFKTLVKKGAFARGEIFYLWVSPQQDLGQARAAARPMIGIIVSRETRGRAAKRNVFKRRIREIFRGHQNQIKKDVACLVKTRSFKHEPSFGSMEEELVALLEKTRAFI